MTRQRLLRLNPGRGSCFLRLVLGQPLLQVARSLELWFLDRAARSRRTRTGIASSSPPLSLGLVKLLQNALIMHGSHVFRDALHSKNLKLQTSTVGEGILDCRECFLVHLVEMYREAWTIS